MSVGHSPGEGGGDERGWRLILDDDNNDGDVNSSSGSESSGGVSGYGGDACGRSCLIFQCSWDNACQLRRVLESSLEPSRRCPYFVSSS